MRIINQSTLKSYRTESNRITQFDENERLHRWMSAAIEGAPNHKPVAEFTELKNDVEIKIELKNLNKSLFDIKLNYNWLYISAYTDSNKSNKIKLKYNIPVSCDPTSLNTNYADGVLYIYFNKKTLDDKFAFESFDLSQIFSFLNKAEPNSQNEHKAS